MDGKRGSLVVVGTGINTVCHLTQEAIAQIKSAEKVLYVVTDPIAESVIEQLNPGACESLLPLYAEGKPRVETYQQMVDRVTECVRVGQRTCVVFYGHPGVFACPAHESIRQLRHEGFRARMLPGISAEDCLFADLGVDPAKYGCQSYEATYFVLYRCRPEITVALVLWQIGSFGQHTYARKQYNMDKLPLLVAYLSEFYPPEHEVCVYEASIFAGCDPRIEWVPLCRLTEVPQTAGSTLYVPPVTRATEDPAMRERLGLPALPSR